MRCDFCECDLTQDKYDFIISDKEQHKQYKLRACVPCYRLITFSSMYGGMRPVDSDVIKTLFPDRQERDYIND